MFSHLAVIDVIPTVEMWDSLTGTGGVFAFHLYFLAQPNDLPERMIGADPDTFFGSFLDNWTKISGAIPPEVRQRYLSACRRPEVIHAICEDYRAGAFIDAGHDSADQQAGGQIKVSTLALWQDPGDIPLSFDPATEKSTWAPDFTNPGARIGTFHPRGTTRSGGERSARAARRRVIMGRFPTSGTDGDGARRSERAQRLGAVLQVLYLVFNEGYVASCGPDPLRVELTDEAIRVVREVRGQLSEEGEVAGLLALMLLTDARRPARTRSEGGLVPLAEQDRSRWNRALIRASP